MKADHIGGVWCGRIALAAALLGFCAQPNHCEAEARQGALVGKPAPSFQLQGIYDEAYSLEQFKGHILVMQFGSSWS